MQRKTNFQKALPFPIYLPPSNRNNSTYLMNHNVDEVHVPEIVFITSYPPRECGIANYSQDLIEALREQFDQSFKCRSQPFEPRDQYCKHYFTRFITFQF